MPHTSFSYQAVILNVTLNKFCFASAGIPSTNISLCTLFMCMFGLCTKESATITLISKELNDTMLYITSSLNVTIKSQVYLIFETYYGNHESYNKERFSHLDICSVTGKKTLLNFFIDCFKIWISMLLFFWVIAPIYYLF